MKKILIIDDSSIQLKMMEGILQNNYELLMTTSGLEGMDIAKKEKPDLIFLDYDMPVMDGQVILKHLREKDETRGIPVVFLTGVNNREDVTEVLKLRPDGYLLKPVEPNRLYETIHKIVGE